MVDKWVRLYKQEDAEKKIYIGMWEDDDLIYFGVEGLTPDDVIGQDIEFPIAIKVLKKLVCGALPILQALEDLRMELNGKERPDSVVRQCEATVAEYFGYETRADWIREIRDQGRREGDR